MSDDDTQAGAEGIDEEVTGTDPVTSDEAGIEAAPDRPHGIQFADADVTDESFAERTEQEEPEVWERAAITEETPITDGAPVAADEELHEIDG